MKSAHPSERAGLRTWIEIDRAAIAHNYKILRGLLPKKTLFMAVVKSNAYGHGLLDFSREIDTLGPDWFGVDSVVEGVALRKAGVTKPMLVLGFTLPENITVALEHKLSLTVSTFETLDAIAKESSVATFSSPLRIHLKVDTGMHRQGFQEADIPRVVAQLQALVGEKKIVVEGLFTHFGAAKNPSFREATNKQLVQFSIWQKVLGTAGFSPITHAAASGGSLIFPEAHFDMARFGIALYGLWPSHEAEAHLAGKVSLKPVLTWKTVIGEVKKVPKGDRVGYDFTEEFSRDSKIAICPIGYWHGFPRALSSVGTVLVRGTQARVLGRVSMDMIIIDVTDVPEAAVLDEVVLIGEQGDAHITAVRVAQVADISHYELVTRLNLLIKRIVV